MKKTLIDLLNKENENYISGKYDDCVIDFKSYQDIDLSMLDCEDFKELLNRKKLFLNDVMLDFVLIFKYLANIHSAKIEIKKRNFGVNIKCEGQIFTFGEDEIVLLNYILEHVSGELILYSKNEMVFIECNIKAEKH